MSDTNGNNKKRKIGIGIAILAFTIIVGLILEFSLLKNNSSENNSNKEMEENNNVKNEDKEQLIKEYLKKYNEEFKIVEINSLTSTLYSWESLGYEAKVYPVTKGEEYMFNVSLNYSNNIMSDDYIYTLRYDEIKSKVFNDMQLFDKNYKIIGYNCNGANEVKKEDSLNDIINKLNFDVSLITYTQLSENQIDEMYNKLKEMNYSYSFYIYVAENKDVYDNFTDLDKMNVVKENEGYKLKGYHINIDKNDNSNNGVENRGSNFWIQNTEN